MLSGSEPGRGAFYGQLTVTRGATDGEFVTKANYRYAEGGADGPAQRASRSSTRAISGAVARPTPRRAARDTVGLREVMFVEPGWEEMSGRWFTGGYEEIGMDVSLKKVSANPVLAGVAPRALRVGTRGQKRDDVRREPAENAGGVAASTSVRASRSRASCARRRTRSRFA